MTDQHKKGPSSFWIPRKAIDALLEAQATAAEIAAYLILAKHTPATGDHSTAGIKAIRIHAGMGDRRAKAAVTALMNITVDGERCINPQAQNAKTCNRLLYSADEWHKRTGEVLPHGPVKWSKVRYVLNTFGTYGGLKDDIVWFGANLVAGVNAFSKPLKTLRQYGDHATWLLLLLYVHNAMEEWGGVSPLKAVFGNYEETLSKSAGRTNYTVSHWNHKYPTAWGSVYQTVIEGVPHHPDIAVKMAAKIKKETFYAPNLEKLEQKSHNQKMADVFWPAFHALESCGFIYEMVTVTTAQPNKKDPTKNDYPLYELDARSSHGYKPKGEEGVAGETAAIARDLDYPVTDGEGHFYGKYAAIAPTGMPIRVVGIYRLRFRVSNPKNATVSDTWRQIGERQKEAAEWIIDLRQRAHMARPANGDNVHDLFGKQTRN